MLGGDKGWCFRVEGVTRMNRVRIEDLRRSSGQKAVLDIVKEKQRGWKVKMEEMNGNRLVKQVHEVTGGRPRGRPRKQWRDNFK